MTNLTIDGETFRVEVDGAADRPSVLLSPSLGTDLSLWDAQMPALLEHFRVIRYDPRGHGRSTALGAPFSLARLGADALGILDALEIETTHFIGISLGGAVGQWLLVNAPERIARAVLANTNARFGTPDLWNGRIASVLAQGTASLATATMERWFSDGFRREHPESVAAIEATFRATAPEGYAASCAALRDMDLRAALIAIERPVLVITGRDDPVTNIADIAAMTDAIAGAQHVALDCKHLSNVEAAAAFNAAVVAFLTARTPARLARPRAPRKPATPMRRPATGRATAARSPLKTVAPKQAPAAKSRAHKPPAGPTTAGHTTAARARAATRVPAKSPAAKAAAAKPPAAKPPAARPPAAKPVRTKRTPATATTLAPKRAGPVASRAVRKAASKKSAATKRAAFAKASRPVKKASAIKKASAVKKASVIKKAPAVKKATSKKATTRRRPAKKPGRPTGRRGR